MKQYICSLSVYLMTTVLLIFKINIDRYIGAPIHGKDVVYGINTRDKKVHEGTNEWVIKNSYHNL